jgi:hypothetical protein
VRRISVADSEALRQRRRKAHVQGDHSLCRRCPVVKPPYAVPGLPPGSDVSPGSGEVKDAALELRQLAFRLVAAHQADPANAILAKELRSTLVALMPKGKPEADADLTGLFSALQA